MSQSQTFFSSLLVVLMVKPKMRSALQSKLLRVRACLLKCDQLWSFDMWKCFAIWVGMFLPFELTREMLHVLSFVRFPCQMTKRFIFAILMWKKNQVCDINRKQFRTFFKGYTRRLKWLSRQLTTELSACNTQHLVILCLVAWLICIALWNIWMHCARNTHPRGISQWSLSVLSNPQ